MLLLLLILLLLLEPIPHNGYISKFQLTYDFGKYRICKLLTFYKNENSESGKFSFLDIS